MLNLNLVPWSRRGGSRSGSFTADGLHPAGASAYLTKYRFSVPALKFNGVNLTVQKFGEVYKILYRKGLIKNDKNKGDEEHCSSSTDDSGADKRRLDNNIARAKSRIREYALCNDWDYFVTLTLDAEKIDRYTLRPYIKRLGEFIGNYNRLRNTRVRYILIPEQHKDGAWHLHGLLNGVASESIQKNEHGYIEWVDYRRRFGFICLSRIRSKKRIAAYITKYVTKGFAVTARESGDHLFYHSQGLNEHTNVCSFGSDLQAPPDYQGKYVGITWIDSENDAEAFAALEAISTTSDKELALTAIECALEERFQHSQHAPTGANKPDDIPG